MQVYLITGNILSLAAVICLAVSVVKKNKRSLIGWQVADTVFCLLSNIALITYSAFTTNFISLIRNLLAYKNLLNKRLTFVLCCLCIVVGLYVNNIGIIGWCPIIASASYTIFMYTTKNAQQMRYALVSNLLLWTVHDFYVQAYPLAITDIVISIWTIWQIWQYHKNIDKKSKDN